MPRVLTFLTKAFLLVFVFSEVYGLQDFIGAVRENNKGSVVVTVQRHLEKEGFHRELITTFDFQGQTKEKCIVMQVEVLSEAFYIDKYQVEEIERMNGYPRVLFVEEPDIEAPAYVSRPYTYIVLHPLEHQQQINITVPIHLRYHAPSSSHSHSSASISPAEMFLLCGDASTLLWNSSSTPLSSSLYKGWKKLVPPTPLPTLDVAIPIGQKEHETTVVAATLATTLLASLLVAVHVLKSTG